MPYCAHDCYFETDDEGRLTVKPACNMCIMGCIDVADNPTPLNHFVRPGRDENGNLVLPTGGSTCTDECLGEHFGSSEQWPKRFDTHFIRDNGNSGVPNGGNPQSDDPTFIASSSPRGFVDPNHQCHQQPAGNPGAPPFNDDAINVTYAANSIQFCNEHDCPVVVDVSASNWYHDLANLPREAVGGARWTGEVRVVTTDCAGNDTEEMEWQRAYETILMRRPNPNGYREDQAGICRESVGPDSLAEALEAMYNTAAGCLRTLADTLDNSYGSYVTQGTTGTPGDQDPNQQYAFPVNAPTFNYPADLCGAYGDGRSSPPFSNFCGCPGSRRHAGEDICVPVDTPWIAVTSGIVRHFGSGSNDNLSLHLEGDDGRGYTYLHGRTRIADGTQVVAGQQIGTVGFPGNAHLHFEVHSPAALGSRDGCWCGGNGGTGTSLDPRPFLTDIANQYGTGGGTGAGATSPGSNVNQNGDPVIVTNQELRERADTLRVCADNFDATQTPVGFQQFCDAVVTNDIHFEDNSAWVDRLVKTGGAWQMPIVIMPGEGIRVETRSRFSKWLYQGFVGDTDNTLTFCDSGGSARSGKITMEVHPIYGGRRCDASQPGQHGNAWWNSSGTNASPTGNQGN